MPLETMKAKRSRLIDPRPYWAMLRLSNWAVPGNDSTGPRYVLMELTDTKLKAFDDRRQRLRSIMAEDAFRAMMMPQFAENGVWIMSKNANNSQRPFIESWLPDDARDKALRELEHNGFALIMQDVGYPDTAFRPAAADVRLELHIHRTYSNDDGLLVNFRVNDEGGRMVQLRTHTIMFHQLQAHIEQAKSRLSQVRR